MKISIISMYLVDLLYHSSVHTYIVDIAIAADYDEWGTESHKRRCHWILAHSDRRVTEYKLVITTPTPVL